MKKTLILFLSVVFSVYTYGQNSFESELIGKWSVENVQVNTSGLSQAQIKYVDSIKSAYDNAVFQFKENTDFNIIIDFKEISDRLQKSCWKYEAE